MAGFSISGEEAFLTPRGETAKHDNRGANAKVYTG